MMFIIKLTHKSLLIDLTPRYGRATILVYWGFSFKFMNELLYKVL